MKGISAMQGRLKVFRGIEPINTCEPTIKADSNRSINEVQPMAYMRKVV